MTFQFTRATGVDDVAEIVYEMPPLPYGVSYRLRKMIAAYTDTVLGGEVGNDDQLFAAINSFKPNGLADVTAKLIFCLHFYAMGSNGERLLIIETAKTAPAIAFAQSALDALYTQMPQGWASAKRIYEASRVAEMEYDRTAWTPAYEAAEDGGAPIGKAVDQEMERLSDVRQAAENVLLDIPAPSFAELAFKYLICFDDDRDLNGYHEDLCAEAKRLLAEAGQ